MVYNSTSFIGGFSGTPETTYTLSISVDTDDSEWSANVAIKTADPAAIDAAKGTGVTFSGRIREARSEGMTYLTIELEPGATFVLDR